MTWAVVYTLWLITVVWLMWWIYNDEEDNDI